MGSASKPATNHSATVRGYFRKKFQSIQFDPMKLLQLFFERRKEKRMINENLWIESLNELGFKKVTFPIILKFGTDIHVIYSLKDFALDVDLYFFEFDRDSELIDSKGQLFSWKYDVKNKTNLPNHLKRLLTLEEVKSIIIDYFRDSKLALEIKEKIDKITAIDTLIEIIADRI